MSDWDLLLFVRWDRCSGDETDMVSTSSARYSRAITEALFGSDSDHNDCRLIADVFGDRVYRLVGDRSRSATDAEASS